MPNWYWGSDKSDLGTTPGGGMYQGTAKAPMVYMPGTAGYTDPNGDYMRKLLGGELGQVEGRESPEMMAAKLGPASMVDMTGATYGGATIDQGASNAIKSGYQMPLLDQLLQQSQGKGPSLASEQLKAGMDQNMASQMAMAGAQKGTANSALAMQNLATMGGNAGQQYAQQAALARMQEQMNAQGQLGALSGQVRGQDLGVAAQQAQLAQQAGMFNAGNFMQGNLANATAQNQYGLQQGQFNQQANDANLKAQLATMGMNDQQKNAYLQMMMGQNEADRQAAMRYQEFLGQQSDVAGGYGMQQMGLQQQQNQYNQNRADDWTNKMFQTAGTAAMFAAMG